MKTFGFNDIFAAEVRSYSGYYVGHVGRVISQYKDLYKVVCENGEVLAVVSG